MLNYTIHATHRKKTEHLNINDVPPEVSCTRHEYKNALKTAAKFREHYNNVYITKNIKVTKRDRYINQLLNN